MAKKLSSVLGVDIGSRKIKIAEVKAAGKDAVVTAIGMVDTPEGAVDHTGVYNSDAVGDALKRVIAESGASCSHVVVSVAGQASVLVRTIEVPKMNPTELKEHMQWEINRNIPFAESTVVSDFKPLGGDDPASQNMDVVMAISPQSAIDTLIACVKRSGKQTAAIDVEPLGLARSVKSSYDDLFGTQSVCIVDVGHKTTSINIFKDGKLLMPRTVPVGGEMFTQAISETVGIVGSEAERMKLEDVDLNLVQTNSSPTMNPFNPSPSGGDFQPYNPFADDASMAPPAPPVEDFVPADPDMTAHASSVYDQPAEEPEPVVTSAPIQPAGDLRALNAITPVLEEFVAEIRRSIDYFRSRGGEVDRVLVCGGGSKLRGLPEFLGKSLGLPCDAYDPLRRLNISAKKADLSFVDEHRAEFAVAVGNGLHILFD